MTKECPRLPKYICRGLKFTRKSILCVAAFCIFNSCKKQDNKTAFLDVAKKHYDSGEIEKAKSEYLKVVEQHPTELAAISQLAQIWMHQGAHVRAMPFLMQIRKLSPRDVASRLKLLDALTVLQISDEVLEEAASILTLDPQSQQATLAFVAAARKSDEVEQARKIISQHSDQESALVKTATALIHLKSGDSTLAFAFLRSALETDPKFVPARSLLAKLLVLSEERETAALEYKTISNTATPRSFDRLAYGDYRLQNNSADEALAEATGCLAKAPDYLPALILAALAATELGKLADAESFLQIALNIDSENFEARLAKARIKVEQKEHKMAGEILEKLLQSYPGNPLVQFRLASVYIDTGDSKKGFDLLNRVVAFSPESVEPALLLAELRLGRGEADVVMTEMRALLKRQPGLVPAIRLLARACQATNRPDEAIQLLESLVKTSPTSVPFNYELGVAMRKAGKHLESRRAFEKILEKSRTELSAINQLIELDIEERNWDSALRRCEVLLGAPELESEGYFLKGKVLAGQKKWSEAEDALRKSMEKTKKHEPASRLLMQVLFSGGKLEAAQECANQVLLDQPDNIEAMLVAADICEKKKDFTAALTHYEKILVRDPENYVIMIKLANLLIRYNNDFERAFSLAKEARKLLSSAVSSVTVNVKQDTARVAGILGRLLYRKKEYKESLGLLKEAINELKENPEIHYHLGMAASMMGEMTLARTSFSTAVQLHNGGGEDFPGREQIPSRLALLGETDDACLLSGKDLKNLAIDNPEDALVHLRLGGVLEKENDFRRAAEAYEHALKQNSSMYSAVVNLAKLYAGPLKNAAKALDLVRIARKLTDSDEHAGVLGGIAVSAHDYALAYTLLNQAVKSDKVKPSVLRDLALASYYLNKINEARELLKRLTDTMPGTPEADEAAKLLVLLNAVNTKTAFEEAVVVAAQVLKTMPDYVPALMVQAKLQSREGNADQAITALQSVLQRTPEFAPAMSLLAAVSIEAKGVSEESARLAEQALKIMPKDPEVIQTAAMVSYFQKNYKLVIQRVQAGARNGQASAIALFYLGMSQAYTEDKAAAYRSLTDAIAGYLPEKLASEARTMLAKVSP